MHSDPYAKLPATAFWRSGAAQPDPMQIRGLWQPKFKLRPQHQIATAGSCFAQHIGRALAARGYGWFDAEAAPGPEDIQKSFYYNTFSFRTGNIYTTKMFLQWLQWAEGEVETPDLFWQKDGRFYDPFRPTVEPGGFASHDEARLSRRATLAAIRAAIRRADVFVFTLGLTECWREAGSGLEYAICPGTLAGSFDPKAHLFHNMAYPEVMAALEAAMALMRRVNPKIRFLLTVSPVPLTATASGEHVITATSLSKSILRAVAGDLAQRLAYVDYFPSYEIITHPIWGGRFYAANKRSVEPAGVAHVMECFFHDLGVNPSITPAPAPPPADPAQRDAAEDAAELAEDIRCEEEMLAAFQIDAAAPTAGEAP